MSENRTKIDSQELFLEPVLGAGLNHFSFPIYYLTVAMRCLAFFDKHSIVAFWWTILTRLCFWRETPKAKVVGILIITVYWMNNWFLVENIRLESCQAVALEIHKQCVTLQSSLGTCLMLTICLLQRSWFDRMLMGRIREQKCYMQVLQGRIYNILWNAEIRNTHLRKCLQSLLADVCLAHL